MIEPVTDQPAPTRSGPSRVAVVVIVLISAVAFVTLIAAGITFAFILGGPIAAQVTEFLGRSSDSDVATGTVHVAGLWWAFAALAAASFLAAALILIVAIRALSRLDDD